MFSFKIKRQAKTVFPSDVERAVVWLAMILEYLVLFTDLQEETVICKCADLYIRSMSFFMIEGLFSYQLHEWVLLQKAWMCIMSSMAKIIS